MISRLAVATSSPAGVSSQRLARCSSSGVPRALESFLICVETVGCARCSSSAARVAFWSRDTASKTTSCGSSPCLK
jgi:hypothetical protein